MTEQGSQAPGVSEGDDGEAGAEGLAAKEAVAAPDVTAAASSEKPGPVVAEPVPLAVPLEEQINALPPLDYPGEPQVDLQRVVDEKRRGRLRLEIIFGGILVGGGVVGFVVTQRPAFLIIGIFAVAGLAAYEFLVESFQ